MSHNAEQTVDALISQIGVLGELDQDDEVQTLATQCFAEAEASDNSALVYNTCARLAGCLGRCGLHAEQLQYLEKAEKAVGEIPLDSSEESKLRGLLSNTRGEAEAASGNPAAAIDCFERAAQLLEAAPTEPALLNQIANARFNAGVLRFQQQESERAADLLKRAAETAECAGDSELAAEAWFRCAVALHETENCGESWLEVVNTLDKAFNAGCSDPQAQLLAMQIASPAIRLADDATAHARAGQLDEAISRHTSAVTLFRRLRYQKQLAMGLDNLGRCHLQGGNPGKAQGFFKESLAICAEHDLNEQGTKSRLSMCYALMDESKSAQALALASEVLTSAEEYGWTEMANEARNLAARLNPLIRAEIEDKLALLRAGSVKEKCLAADWLAKLDAGNVDSRVVDALIDALGDEGEECESTSGNGIDAGTFFYVRENAVRALGQIAPEAAAKAVIPVIVELLDRPSTAGYAGPYDVYTPVRFSENEIAAFGEDTARAISCKNEI